jgi:hypothetical protein
LAGTGAQIIGTVHDEIILKIHDRVAWEFTAILKQTLDSGRRKLTSVKFRLR